MKYMLLAALTGLSLPAMAEDVDMVAIYAKADQQHTAREPRGKRAPSMPARPNRGEVAATLIAGDGV